MPILVPIEQKSRASHIVTAILGVSQGNFPILAILDEFLNQGNPEWLAERSAEVEQVVTRTKVISAKCKEVRRRCLLLKPVPTPQLPLGF
ncbi:MAG: hypothetical protein DPW09_05860 [Anaerolineae bacterium]|nr:hypothetical protein [Anaerolineae bacterium]MCQ3972961.1 hypothetical protein [Anaerolineae bacterium]